MARTKKLNIVVVYGNTGYCINDLGADKPKRFELYCEPEDKVILKTNNPLDCHEWMEKNIWKGLYNDNQ